MDKIFEKKFKKNLPKRTFLHKLHIFLTFIWLVNLAGSFANGNKTAMALHALCVFCWGINWYFSSKKYKQSVLEYTEQFNKEKQEEEMKNAFNFGYYQQK